MRLPFHISLIEFLQEQGYNYWLTMVEDASEENFAPKITLVPVQNTVCLNLPDGYTYFKIQAHESVIASGHDYYQIAVHVNTEDFVGYKKSLIKKTSSILN